MYPIVHNYDATEFRTQGFGSLSDCISCEVTEELNGGFTLEMTYPLNGLHSEYLVVGNIIVAKPNHNQSRQPFRISEVKKSFANNIQVYANHICYDLSGYPVRSSYTYNSLAATIQGMNSIAASMATPASSLVSFRPFTFSTDMTSSVSFSMEAIQTLRAWMGGQDNSLINVYGGEWAYDNFNCFLTSRRGQDTGYRISYGKNLAEYEKDRTYTEYSHVCAYWKKSDAVAYSDIVSTGIDCSFRCGYVDASGAYENQPTTAQLNAYASSAVSSLGFGAQTVTVTPAQIGNDIIGIGDSVLICYETVFQTRVIKTVWDVLAGVYKTLQLGTRKANITDTLKSLSTAPSGTGGSSPITITVDYVTEQGTLSGWKYRRWASGRAEAFITTTFTGENTTSRGILRNATLNAVFGSSDSTASNTILHVINANADTNDVHIEGVTYIPRVGTWYALFDRQVTTSQTVAMSIRAEYFV